MCGLYGLAYLALRKLGAKDWKNGLAISLHHRGQQFKLQSHHIFPKAKLKDRFDAKTINEIANRAFISWATNRWFSDSLPEKYLSGVVRERGPEALQAQCVSAEPEEWVLDRYPAFLEKRRRQLIEQINAMLDDR